MRKTALFDLVGPGIEMQLAAEREDAIGISFDEALKHLLGFPDIEALGF